MEKNHQLWLFTCSQSTPVEPEGGWDKCRINFHTLETSDTIIKKTVHRWNLLHLTRLTYIFKWKRFLLSTIFLRCNNQASIKVSYICITACKFSCSFEINSSLFMFSLWMTLKICRLKLKAGLDPLTFGMKCKYMSFLLWCLHETI